jgi:endonuclease-8
MPEGPSILILKELVQPFESKKIIAASGNAKIDMNALVNEKVNFKTWGKHFLICTKKINLRVHFLMFGTYVINGKKDKPARLSLTFKNGEINIYTAAIKTLEEDVDEIYDWSADVMSDTWNAKKAKQKLKQLPEIIACDALLDQQIFSGVGNIIKNEVLFISRIHPLTEVKNLPSKKLNELIKLARDYSFDFLKWKKEYTLKKHWLVYNKKTCPRCNIPLHKENLGKTKRSSFFCNNCQILYK